MIQTTLFPDTFKHKYSSSDLSEFNSDSNQEAVFSGCDFSNDDIADMFEQIADLLTAQGDDYYRIRAYREGARSVRQREESVVDLYASEGLAGLQKLPHIGDRLSACIQELATTGELTLLERLLIDVSPEDLFTTVPGIGQLLARRIYRELGILTLEGLEQAAYDGSLAQLEGFGIGRVKIVRAALETMLGRASRQRVRRWHQDVQTQVAAAQVSPDALLSAPSNALLDAPSNAPSNAQQTEPEITPATYTYPSIELLLEVDEHYRYLAKAGQLRMVTPRRFNPEGKRWLPVMRLKKEGWSFNVLYSNTARAHELGKTNDWVVIYYEPIAQADELGRGRSGQCTIVTETRGTLRGQRVIRGMEAAAA